MLRLLFKYIIPFGVLLVAFFVGYNYFFGTAAEKQNAQKIVSQVTGLGADVINLLVSEKDKFDEGKYDQALDKIGLAISSLKDLAADAVDGGQAWLDKLQDLEQQQDQLEKQLAELKSQSSSAAAESAESIAPGRAARRSSGAESSESSLQISIEDLETQIKLLAEQTEQMAREIGSQ